VTGGGKAWDGEIWAPNEEAEGESTDDGGWWEVGVELGRKGNFVGPVEVELEWEDGSRERRTWDGSRRWTRWSIDARQRLSSVVVDPDGVWALETRRQDNYWADEGDSRVACRRLWWISEALQLLGLAPVPWS